VAWELFKEVIKQKDSEGDRERDQVIGLSCLSILNASTHLRLSIPVLIITKYTTTSQLRSTTVNDGHLRSIHGQQRVNYGSPSRIARR
jgi:hypothetical protein